MICSGIARLLLPDFYCPASIAELLLNDGPPLTLTRRFQRKGRPQQERPAAGDIFRLAPFSSVDVVPTQAYRAGDGAQVERNFAGPREIDGELRAGRRQTIRTPNRIARFIAIIFS